MKKLCLLFDADDTILDFDAAETASFTRTVQKYGLDIYPNIVPRYKKINAQVWQEYESHILTREQIGTTRFARLFDEFGIEGIDSVDIGNEYWRFLSQTSNVIDGAREMLEKIYKNHDMYVITNGEVEVQKGRFNAANLNKYFKDKFVSEGLKLRKPDKAFFDYIETVIGPFDRENTYIIGDSLTSDIKGGENANLKTIWFNNKNKINDKGIKPDFEVKNYVELVKLIDELSKD